MSEPQPPMDQAEQAKVTRSIGRALLGVAPPEWTSIRAEYRSVGRHIEVDVFVAGPDRVPHPVRPPMEVVDGLGRLRAGMYQPGRGTWISAVYTLEPPSSFTVDFEPDAEPRWRRLPPPIGFQDELRFFPRADENIPPWFRYRAGLPPAPPAQPPAGAPAPPAAGQPTPPSGIPAQPAPGQPPVSPPGQPAHGQPAMPPAGLPIPAQPPAGSHPAPIPGQPTPPSGSPAQPVPGQPPPFPAQPPSAGPFSGQPPNGISTPAHGQPTPPNGTPGPGRSEPAAPTWAPPPSNEPAD